MKLNIGCGKDVKPGYLNADLHPLNEAVEEVNLLSMPFKTGTFEEILALDVIEHVSWRKVTTALAEIARVLKPGGSAEIRVPDIDALLELRKSGRMTEKEFVRRVFGDQGRTGDYHYAGFTEGTLLDSIKAAGLRVEKTWTKNGNRIAMCRRPS